MALGRSSGRTGRLGWLYLQRTAVDRHLICAGLLLQTLRNLRLFDPGFDRSNLYATWTEFQGGRPGNGQMVKEIERRMQDLPGARATAASDSAGTGPLSGSWWSAGRGVLGSTTMRSPWSQWDLR